MRNLNDYDFHGRTLRVSAAAGDHITAEKGQPMPVGPAQEEMYGDAMEPTKAPEAISKAVASLPPEQMFELMKQMKVLFVFSSIVLNIFTRKSKAFKALLIISS